ncbi:hypothetical protein GWK47_049425 [Chionoecetes opilio]|uniref:Uncharacterized protein n=1 Tax=Chionoecetes opilio TaxID=41210 RepID=A0A8J4Y9B2_CHIOP|nr:hypothetical protein GWK47_049425 [Chionoecetes opilio]
MEYVTPSVLHCVAPFFPRRRQFLASEEVVRHVRFPSRFPDSLDAVLSKLLLEVACARRKLGAGATRGKHADESLRLSVWVWVGGRSVRGGTGSRPDIPPQLAEGGVLVEGGAPSNHLASLAAETPAERESPHPATAAGAKKYKAGISPPVRRVSRQATGGSRGDVVTVSHLRHLVTLPGATGCGYVMYQRGRGAARSTPNITSLGLWRTMRGGPAFTPTQQPPTCRLGGGGRAGLRGAVAGQDRR